VKLLAFSDLHRDRERAERLVELASEAARPDSGCCSRWQPAVRSRAGRVLLSELLAEQDGEDLDRVLEAIAVVKRHRIASAASPDDLWIRAYEPDE
jgi:hypothetical protein